MPKWLEIYLNWWGSQTDKIMEMTLIDFVVSIPLALLPLVLLYWFVAGFKSSKRTDKHLSQLKSPLFDMSIAIFSYVIGDLMCSNTQVITKKQKR